MNYHIRKANQEDIPIVFDLMMQLARYEKMENEVQCNAEQLRENVFEKKLAEIIVCEVEQSVVGFALYFYNYSTFVGKPGLYLEDLFVDPNYRGKGLGKALLLELAKIAHQKSCGRMEWSVLNWNSPAINFYQSLGAKPMDTWTVYRLDAKKIEQLAQE